MTRTYSSSRSPASAAADALGWFSIGLGLAELVAARPIAARIGLRGQEGLLRAYGAREIVTGIGLLTGRGPERMPWMWGRVAGDVLDLATLAAARRRSWPWQRGGAGLAMMAVLGVTALDLLTATALSVPSRRQRRYRAGPPRDYSARSGYPQGVQAARGAARDFQVPRDFRTPDALRPWQAA